MKKEIKENYSLYLGDNLQWLKTIPSDSVDSVVTDPPYGLSFLGKTWDYDVPTVELWKEVYRVLKPGGHLLSFGGTRTYHRMAVNIEEAGFEIRDQLQWIYGQGFPKSHDIGKAIDKIQGNEREVIGMQSRLAGQGNYFLGGALKNGSPDIIEITKGQTKFESWGTTLKPANEPICLARKPISEKTIARNVIKYGTGGINIGDCRIDFASIKDEETQQNKIKCVKEMFDSTGSSVFTEPILTGRFPSNVILDESMGEILDEQSGIKHQGHWSNSITNGFSQGKSIHKGSKENEKSKIGASKFFYIPKPTKKEKSMGLDQISNSHPTVKPITLISYLVRLITPADGTVLDPFMGSGTGGISTLLEGFKFIGMDQDPEYFKIAKERIKEYESYREIFIKKHLPKKDLFIHDEDIKPVSTFWLNQAV